MTLSSARILLGVALFAAGLERPAAAADSVVGSDGETVFRASARAGFAAPWGASFEGSGPLADTVMGQIPLRVDLATRFSRHLYAGVFAHFGVLVPNSCVGDMSCSGTSTRLGLMLEGHLFPSGRLDPWVGVGMGYEWLSMKRELSSTRLDLLARGIELLNAELGVDVRAMSNLRIGPIGSVSFGRFTSIRLNGVTTNDFAVVMHGWHMLALRAAYEF